MADLILPVDTFINATPPRGSPPHGSLRHSMTLAGVST
jgi:hypothetical protein